MIRVRLVAHKVYVLVLYHDFANHLLRSPVQTRTTLALFSREFLTPTHARDSLLRLVNGVIRSLDCSN